jgi:hypothetical protein
MVRAACFIDSSGVLGSPSSTNFLQMIRLATRADGLIENRSAVRENHLSDPSRVTFADYHWFIDHAGVHV